jgi:hypothetical protein
MCEVANDSEGCGYGEGNINDRGWELREPERFVFEEAAVEDDAVSCGDGER